VAVIVVAVVEAAVPSVCSIGVGVAATCIARFRLACSKYSWSLMHSVVLKNGVYGAATSKFNYKTTSTSGLSVMRWMIWVMVVEKEKEHRDILVARSSCPRYRVERS
jgi:hypothetical protein